jgi:DNA-binding winged helix-turn-helix (wHTH) protein
MLTHLIGSLSSDLAIDPDTCGESVRERHQTVPKSCKAFPKKCKIKPLHALTGLITRLVEPRGGVKTGDFRRQCELVHARAYVDRLRISRRPVQLGRAKAWAGPQGGEAFLFEGFRLDRADGRLFRENGSQDGEPLALGSRAAALLGLLVERQGKLVTKDEIFATVWLGTAVEEANLTVQISTLRLILDRDRREPGSCIQTVPGRGYRFVAPVRATAPSTSPCPNGTAKPTVVDHFEAGRSNGANRFHLGARGPVRWPRYRLGFIIKATAAGGFVLPRPRS